MTFDAALPAGGTTPVTVYITHDNTDLYVAVTFDRQSAFHLNDIVAFEFDNDNDGLREDGDDIILRHDLNSADDTHDFSIDVPPPTTVGVTMQVSLEADPSGSNTYTHTHYPSSTTYCQLTIGKKSTSLSCPAA